LLSAQSLQLASGLMDGMRMMSRPAVSMQGKQRAERANKSFIRELFW